MSDPKNDNGNELMGNTIKRLTFDDMVNFFYNMHLKTLVACWTDIICYEKLNPEDVAMIEKMIGPNGQVVMGKQIKVKEAIKNQKNEYNKHRSILAALEEVKIRFKDFEVGKELK